MSVCSFGQLVPKCLAVADTDGREGLLLQCASCLAEDKLVRLSQVCLEILSNLALFVWKPKVKILPGGVTVLEINLFPLWILALYEFKQVTQAVQYAVYPSVSDPQNPDCTKQGHNVTMCGHQSGP